MRGGPRPPRNWPASLARIRVLRVHRLGPFRSFWAPGLGMQLLRGLRLWGLGASAGLVAAARAPGASRYHRPLPRPRAPRASPPPRLRPLLALSPWSQRPAVVACGDPSPANAACMELPGAGELGRAVWGDWSLGAWARVGRREGPALPPRLRPQRLERDPTPALLWGSSPPPPRNSV